jgi:SAM-dependent methyltransferase
MINPSAGAHLYDTALVYEEAFGFRDIAKDTDTLLRWARERLGRELQSALELECGPAYLGVELARRGRCVVGLDNSTAMLERAFSRAKEAGATSFEGVVGDMARFDLGRTFDSALCIVDSLCHILSVADLITHLRTVSAHLVTGGLYIIEQFHPRWVFSAEALTQEYPFEVVSGGHRYVTSWGLPTDEWDPIGQLRRLTVLVKHEKGGRLEELVRDQMTVKVWTATETEACIAASGVFEFVGRYGAWSGDVPFSNNADSSTMISILKKK